MPEFGDGCIEVSGMDGDAGRVEGAMGFVVVAAGRELEPDLPLMT